MFAIADQVIGAEEQKLMVSAFDRAEQSNGNSGKHERYIALANELTRWPVATA